MSNEVLKLDELNASNLPELQGLKQKQEELVKENPFIEITDNATFETAKKHRTALLKGRTTLEAQDKLIASKLTNFRKQVKSITDDLISITLPHETKQQEEVKRFEEIKENERIERDKKEQVRIDLIKQTISELETEGLTIIQKSNIQNVKENKSLLDKLVTIDFDFEEFEILFDQVKQRLQNQFDSKCAEIQEKENQRLENERLQREKAESDAKLKAIEDQQAKEKSEREEKEKAEKEKVFLVRKNRLEEIGLILNILDVFVHPLYDLQNRLSYEKQNIFNCDVLEFENLLTDAKNSIKESVVREAKQQMEKEAAEKLEKENKAKAEKENKARIKRLAQDKAIYKQTLSETIGRFPLFFEANQVEVKEFSIEASNRVADLYKELLTELENL